MKRIATILGAAGVMLFQATTAMAQNVDVAVGTTSARSSFFAYYATVSKLATEMNAPVRITVSETGGIEENLARMSKGQLNAGLIAMRPLYEAYHGVSGNWKDNPQKQLRLLNLFMVAPQAFMVTEGSGVTSVAGLAGTRWSPGHRGSGSQKATMQIMKVLGIEPDYYQGAMPDLVAATKNGEIIGFSKGLPGFRLDATFLDIQTTRPIRILGFSDEQVTLLRKDFPSLPHLKLPAALANMPEDQNSWAFLPGAAANADMPDEAAYWLTKIAIERRDEIAKVFKPAGETDPIDLTLSDGNIPLHPGAVRYFQEIGKTIPDRLMP